MKEVDDLALSDRLHLVGVKLRNIESFLGDNYRAEELEAGKLSKERFDYVAEVSITPAEENDDEHLGDERFMHVFKYLSGVRLMKVGYDVNSPPDPIFELKATFEAEYVSTREEDVDLLEQYSASVSQHVWPFWSELIGNIAYRFNIPTSFLKIALSNQNTPVKLLPDKPSSA